MHFPNMVKALDSEEGLGSVVAVAILEHYDDKGETILGGYMSVRQNGTAPPDIVIKNVIHVEESLVLSGVLIWEETCHGVGKRVHFHLVLCECHASTSLPP